MAIMKFINLVAHLCQILKIVFILATIQVAKMLLQRLKATTTAAMVAITVRPSATLANRHDHFKF